MHKQKNKMWYGYLFVSPFIIVFAIFGLYPIIYTMYLSFQSWDGLAQIIPVGFKNYSRLVTDPVFLQSVWNTVRIWGVNFIFLLITALFLSGVFSLMRIKGMRLFRAAFYLPNLITAASVGLLFNLLFTGDRSVANSILTGLGVDGAPFDFFNSTVFTSGMVSYIQWWMWFGYTTIILMAGITTIDTQVYESAKVDGATKFEIYRYITLPLIKPTVIYVTITSIIGGMQIFDIPATLTGGMGDPQGSILTVSMYLYNQAFRYHNYGYAATVSVGLFVIIALLSSLSFKAMQKKGEE